MKDIVRKLIIRNAIEVAVILFLFKYFNSLGKVSSLSLIPLLFVLLVFIFDLYTIYKFYSSRDLDGLLHYQSKFIFYSFAWYFLPAFLSIYLILKNLNSVSGSSLIAVSFIYILLYLYNLKISRNLKMNLI